VVTVALVFHRQVLRALRELLETAAPPQESAPLLAEGVWSERAARWREARHIGMVGVGTYLSLLLFWGALQLLAWFTGQQNAMQDFGLTIETNDGAAILAAFAGIVVAIALASRPTANAQPLKPADLLRAQVLEQLGKWSSSIAALVGCAVLAGAFTGRESDLLARGALAALAGVLSSLATFSIPPTEDERRAASDIEATSRLKEAERFTIAAANWAGPRRITRGWLACELMRWVLLVMLSLLLPTMLHQARPPHWEAAWGSLILGVAFVVIGGIGTYFIRSLLGDLVDQNRLFAISSGIMLAIWVATGILIATELWMDDSLDTFGRTLIGAYTTAAFLAFPLVAACGASHRLKRWSWFRPGLIVRAALERQCNQRSSDLDTTKRMGKAASDRRSSRAAQRARRAYAEIIGERRREQMKPGEVKDARGT
jgi:hypothetical protein